MLARRVVLLSVILFTHPGLAEGNEYRTLRLLLEKHNITQKEYD